MKKFTYYDYIKYKNQITDLSDRSEEYELENNIHQYRDKGFKVILEEKEEAIQLINSGLGIENTKYSITKKEIVKYNNNFITQSFSIKEADVIYKKKNEDIFFLIEHQSTVDYSMPYRLLNYCIEIIRHAVNKKELKNKNYKMPVVYPIVLYTGERKWNVKKYFEECQMRLPGVKRTVFTAYNLIDIHNYTEKELWNKENFLSRILLLEKAKQNNQIEAYMDKIVKENFNDKEMNVLLKMIQGSLNRKIEEIDLKEFFIKMKEKRGGTSMLTALEEYMDNLIERGIEKGEEEGIKKGARETKKEIILRMIKNKMDEETILLMTEITQEELEKIKQQNKKQ